MNRKLLYIRWLDHQEIDESTSFDEEVGPAIMHTVGIYTGETDEWVEIARDITLNDEGVPEEKYSPICILKRCILTIYELKTE